MHYEKLKDPFIDAETDFWIGDPCYVVPDSNWPHLCHNWSAYEKEQEELGNELPKCYVAEVQHEPTGYVFYCWSTAYGDGSYKLFVDDKEVAILGVDAGTLSAIPVGLIDYWKRNGEISDYEDLGHVVDSENLYGELICDGGDAFWGRMRLPTGWSEDHDEDEYDECCEYSFV